MNKDSELEITEENLEKVRNGTHPIKFKTIEYNGRLFVRVIQCKRLEGLEEKYVDCGKIAE